MEENTLKILKAKLDKAFKSILSGNNSFQSDPSTNKDDLNKILDLCNSFMHDLDNISSRVRNNDAVKLSKRYFNQVFENIADAFYLVEIKTGRIVDTNLRASEQTGYSKDEILKKQLSEIIHDDSGLNSIYEDLNYDEPLTVKRGCRCKDGAVFPVEIRVTLVEIDEEKYALLLVQDITERLNTIEKLLLTQFSNDKASDSIFWIEPDGRIIYGNEAACKSLEYTKEELMTKTIFDIDPTFPREKWKEHWQLSKEKGSSLIETKHITKSGKIFPVEVSINVLIFGDKEYHSAFARNISERKKTEETLLLNQYAIDSASIGIVRSGENGEILSANDQVCKSLDYTKEELYTMYIWEIDPEFPKERWQNHRKLIYKTGSDSFRTVHKRKDGTVFPVEVTTNYREFNGQVFSLSFVKDITEQEHAENALKESEYLLRESQRVARLGHYAFDTLTGYWKGSEVLYSIYGVDDNYEKDVSGWLNIVHPDHAKMIEEYLANHVLAGRKHFDREYKIIRINDKAVRWVHGLGELKIENNKVVQMIGTVQDITERKLTEEKLKSSLKEKDVLLKELYHRTKNNMQVIRSMLAMQSVQISDEEVKKIFLETENRILTMSLVHQKLYQSQNLSSIDLKEYIEELIPLLIKSYNVSDERVTTKFNLEKISVLIDIAIPCGLIINELLANSLKHGFPDGRSGELKISLSKMENNNIEFIFSDNGVGVPEGFDFRNQATLGLQTIITIVEHQLQGKAIYKADNGVACNIHFNNSLYTSRV